MFKQRGDEYGYNSDIKIRWNRKSNYNLFEEKSVKEFFYVKDKSIEKNSVSI